MSYGKVHDVYWDDDKIESISDRAALLGLFLITGAHRNAIGCFRLGVGAIMDVPRFGIWGIEGVCDALSDLEQIAFIARDERTGWTCVLNALKHDPIAGSKAAVHAAGLTVRIPKDTEVYNQLFQRLEPQLSAHEKALEGKPGWPLVYPSDTLSHTLSDTPSKGYGIPQPSPLPLPLPNPTQPSVACSSEIESEGAGETTESNTEPDPAIAVGKRCLEILGWQSDPTKNFAPVWQWLADGADPDRHVYPVLNAAVTDGKAASAKTMKYFDAQIREAMANSVKANGTGPLKPRATAADRAAMIDRMSKNSHAQLPGGIQDRLDADRIGGLEWKAMTADARVDALTEVMANGEK